MTCKSWGDADSRWVLADRLMFVLRRGNSIVPIARLWNCAEVGVQKGTGSLALPVSIIRDKSCWWYNTPLIWCGENHTLPLWSSSAKPISQKKHQSPHWRVYLQYIWPVLLKTLKVIKNQASHNQGSQPRRAWADITKWNVVIWMGFRNRKRTLGEN